MLGWRSPSALGKFLCLDESDSRLLYCVSLFQTIRMIMNSDNAYHEDSEVGGATAQSTRVGPKPEVDRTAVAGSEPQT